MEHQKKGEVSDGEELGWIEYQDTRIGVWRPGVMGISLSPRNTVDAAGGRLLLAQVGSLEGSLKLLMDRAYEDDQARLTA
ncbi:MAG: hypothetical protein LBJ41_00005 [Treponema sp.]|jgi:hypothetical protein|nr:hypothetical protein [Treponema sp.]